MTSIIKLNIGGFKHETTLDTLNRDPNSMLASMFSGRHTTKLGDDGYYFIDRNGKYFEYIIKFLRDGNINLESPSIDMINDILDEAKYYNLEDLIHYLEKRVENHKPDRSDRKDTIKFDMETLAQLFA